MLIGPIELGTVAGWVTASGMVSTFALLFKFLPKWVEVKTAERKSDGDIAKGLRDELVNRLNDCESKHQEMMVENDALRNRIVLLEDGDRRKTIALTLVMNEVSRLDPTSDIIIRAKAVLELSINLSTPEDRKMSQALNRLDGGK